MSHGETVAESYFTSCVADIEKEVQRQVDALAMYRMVEGADCRIAAHLLYGVSLEMTLVSWLSWN